jgi:acetyl/propionyl-CoA carboxylase alpha subunit
MHTILIANRGEIARRISRSCQGLGFRTVAIYSEADEQLPHVREADIAVCVGAAPSEHSYLNIDAILAAAARVGADAVHPGYGFLSENATFAQRVQDAGLVWIGPSPDSIASMGDKSAARRLAVAHNVPVLQGFDEPDATDEQLLAAAESIGFPLLIKAAAGGGGRGMRVVRKLDEMAQALQSARREAESAFGNGAVLLERYVSNPRHIEVQLLGDTHGNICHLFERECSIQRRHQKIVEEAPSPGVDPALRERLGEAGIRIAAAASYVGAGTAEFLVDEGGDFFFLEMNTRLQVEHPVTELITGVDLVALQVRIAMGEPLPFRQEDLAISGHAIEARLYAEDPNRDYMAGVGTLHRFAFPEGPGLRLDAGYGAGDEVGIHYDPMIAKVIAAGPDRATATRRIRRSLAQGWVPGIVTNLPLLREIFAHTMWEEAALTTGFLAAAGLPNPPPANPELGILGGVLLLSEALRQVGTFPNHVPLSWRVEGTLPCEDSWLCAGEEWTASWQTVRDGSLRIVLCRGADEEPTEHRIRLHEREGDTFLLEREGVRESWRILKVGGPGATLEGGDTVYVHSGSAESFVALAPRFPSPAEHEAEPGSCTAPTPGTVVAVHVEAGQAVERGAMLVTLEAMKMEHRVSAPQGGVVEKIRVAVGDTVDEGALLVQLSVDEEDA